MHSFKDLEVWNRSMLLVKGVYEYTDQFPNSEKFGLVSQMRRCAVSIPSNIAEGRRRGTRQDYKRFVQIAYGSVAELETQIAIAEMLGFGEDKKREEILRLLVEVSRMTNGLLRALSK